LYAHFDDTTIAVDDTIIAVDDTIIAVDDTIIAVYAHFGDTVIAVGRHKREGRFRANANQCRCKEKTKRFLADSCKSIQT
jgi:hypothetical protein